MIDDAEFVRYLFRYCMEGFLSRICYNYSGTEEHNEYRIISH